MNPPKVGDKYHLNNIKDLVYKVTRVGPNHVVLKGPNNVILGTVVSMESLERQYTKI